jgi:hypothetical protein
LIYIGLGESTAAPWLRLLALYQAEDNTEATERVSSRLQAFYPYLTSFK